MLQQNVEAGFGVGASNSVSPCVHAVCSCLHLMLLTWNDTEIRHCRPQWQHDQPMLWVGGIRKNPSYLDVLKIDVRKAAAVQIKNGVTITNVCILYNR